MAKMYTEIGYCDTQEIAPGRFKEVLTARNYTVDIIRMSKRWEASDGINDNINVNNEFSVLADPYALNHFHGMKYIMLWGQPWKIQSVTVEYPRLKLSIGGVYNGKLARPSDNP